MASTSPPLTQQQAHALFDILVHNEVSSEISRFKDPTAIDGYGPPFDAAPGDAPSSSPVLQGLLQRFVLPLPGLRDVKPDFWETRCRGLVKKLAEAELSDSYDKGRIGSRRTLSTASAVLIEYPARGCLGGLPKRERRDEPQEREEYDLKDEDDVLRAWDDFCQGLIYGDMIDRVFDKMAETPNLEEHDDVIRGAHEYMLINAATFIHYIMHHSPDGPYLARLFDNIHKLIPYMMMRQTLKVGNAATMINGMVRLLLTKLSVGAVTNWLGLSKAAHDGMNLMQQIISTVIHWDIAELHRQAGKVEKSKDAPSKEYLTSIKEYLKKPRNEHEESRALSKSEGKSLVAVIFERAELPTNKLSEAQHSTALDYLSVLLSVRDREQLMNVFCHLQPDILTQATKDLVAAYDSVIRGVHNAVDLSTGLWDYENYINDFLKLARPHNSGFLHRVKHHDGGKASGTSTPVQPPSVEDYVALLRKHTPSMHRFLHQIAKNGGDVTDKYKDYVKRAALNFRAKHTAKDGHGGAGMMTPQLEKLVADLSDAKREEVLLALDAHAAYLTAVECSSRDRLRAVLSNARADTRPSSAGSASFAAAASGQSHIGPGIYLSRWQQLIDSTPITPDHLKGPVRHGADESVRELESLDLDGKKKAPSVGGLAELGIEAPDVSIVIESLSGGFAGVLAEASQRSIHREDKL